MNYAQPVTSTAWGLSWVLVPKFSELATSLATRRQPPDEPLWTKEMDQAYREITQECYVLIIPISDDELFLHTDASGRGMEAVLCVKRAGKELLGKSNFHNAIAEQECLAVVQAILVFISLVDMLKLLQTIKLWKQMAAGGLTGRLARWVLNFQQYHFKVQCLSVAKHLNADGLARQAWVRAPNSDGDAAIIRKGKC